MYTTSEQYAKETFLDQRRKDLLDSSTRNRLLRPSRLDSLILPEKKERFQVLIYRLAYVLVLVFIITFLAVEVVTAVSGAWVGGGGGGVNLVR
jgi:hypothetical protein